MQTLRHMTCLARLVLAGFLLSLGVAVASPAVTPRPLEMVCSGGVYKWVAPSGASTDLSPTALECPQCVPAGLPPSAPHVMAGPDWSAAILPQRPQAIGPAVHAAWPPPARAPPDASA